MGGILLLCVIVCANFGCPRGVTSKVYSQAWHGHCYVQSIKDVFTVMDCNLEDEDLINEEVMEADDKMRFKEA